MGEFVGWRQPPNQHAQQDYPQGAARLFLGPAPIARSETGLSAYSVESVDAAPPSNIVSTDHPTAEYGATRETPTPTAELNSGNYRFESMACGVEPVDQHQSQPTVSDLQHQPVATVQQQPKYPVFSNGLDESHASLLDAVEDTIEAMELNAELARITAAADNAATIASTSALRDSASTSSSVGSATDAQQMRRHCETQATMRPRSQTPVNVCAIDTFISSQETENKLERTISDAEKMKVVIPGQEPVTPKARVRRRSSMSWQDFYDNMSQQLPPQVALPTATVLRQQQEYDNVAADLFEANPKAPPCPVIHRKSSVEWEVFGDQMRIKDPHTDYQMATTGEQQTSAPGDITTTEDDHTAQVDLTAAPTEHSHLNGGEDTTAPPTTATNDYPAYDYGSNSYQTIDPNPYQPYSADYTTAAVDDGSSYYTGYTANQYDTSGAVPAYYTGADYATQGYDVGNTEQTAYSGYDTTEGYDQQQYGAYDAPPAETSQYYDTSQNEASTYESAANSYYAPTTQPYYAEQQSYSEQQQPPYNMGEEQPSHTDWTNESGSCYAPSYDASSVSTTTVTRTGVYNTAWDEPAAPPIPPPPAEQPPPAVVPPQRPPPPPKEEPKEMTETPAKADDTWLEFQRITDKVNLMVAQTQKNLKNIEESSVTNELKSVQPYFMRDETPAENVMDMTGAEMAERQKKQTDVVSPDKEWKPISAVLNEEIKKQREANKPSRPPPPRPMRPVGPAAAVSAWDGPPSAWNQSVAAAPAEVVSRKTSDGRRASLSRSAYAAGIYPSWDDDHSEKYYEKVPAYGEGPPPPPPPLTKDGELVETPYDAYKQQKAIETGVLAPDGQTELENGSQEFPKLPSGLDNLPPEPEKPPDTSGWTNMEEDGGVTLRLPESESGFFSRLEAQEAIAAVVDPDHDAAFAPPPTVDMFAPLDQSLLMQQSYDPFDVKSGEEAVEEARRQAQAEIMAHEAQEDLEYFGLHAYKENDSASRRSSVTEGASPVRSGFEDEFTAEHEDDRTPSPLYDEDDSEPLVDFPDKFTGDGWELMLRHPLKKKLMTDRYWKPCFVRIHQNTILLFNDRKDQRPFQEMPLQASYCLSDVVLQQYDIYGKIHTVKLQYVLYKERVGLRPGQLPKLVEGQFTKLGLPLEHAAQSTALLKFGSLHVDQLMSFVHSVEDVLFACASRREHSTVYKQDEIQIHCYDEYSAYVDRIGCVSQQKARVRLFCLAFASGMPYIEIGLNDRRRQGKEVVRRKDIMPMYTDRWIRFEALEFHENVIMDYFNKEHVIKLMPPDGCFFEVMRFRVRPPKNRELPLTVRPVMKLAGSKIEIRIECMVAGFQSRKAHQVPCEDIQIRFPIPEAWIYLFREERHWGYGSKHAKTSRPGKVKNLKDRILGTVQTTVQGTTGAPSGEALMEAAIGDAKYEHVYRALVWRIPRLPEKHHGAYKSHLLRCRFELSSFDLMPEEFLPCVDVEFTMPLATVSNTVIRSVSLEMHEDPDKVEKFVRYLARCQYKVETDYVQCADLDMDAVMGSAVPESDPALQTAPDGSVTEAKEVSKAEHAGYRIDFTEDEFGGSKFDRKDSSDSSGDEGKKKKGFPQIKIDMTGYGY